MAVVAIVLLSLMTWAQGLAAVPVSASPSPAPAHLTDGDLDAWLSPFVRDQLARLEAAGSVVVVVYDGRVVLSRGYGLADVEAGRRMTDATIIRPGSISKLVTAVAVLQLVEHRTLDLDRDVNDYLDFRIPTPPGGLPVTLRLLLTHRAGFENHLKGLFERDRAPEPLGAWLRRSLPTRLFPYGDVPAYSNYGYALAGYIVARAAQTSFEEYAAAHVFRPLGMSMSTFEQPPPRAWWPLLSRGYRRATSPALPYIEIVPPSPAGGMSTRGVDIGRFMLALLEAGEPNGASLLRRETVRQMLTPFPLPALPGERGRLAFEETTVAGNRFVGKHGLTDVAVSDLELLPESHFGLFVSYNTRTALAGASTALLRGIVERYFRHEAPVVHALPTAAVDASVVGGAYQMSQREDSSVLRLLALLQQPTVTALPDGRLTLSTMSAALQETAPLVFEGPNDLQVTFRRRPRDSAMTMHVNAMPLAMEWERVPWRLDRRVVLPLVGLSLLLAASTIVFWPVAAIVRRRRGRPFGAAPRDRREHLAVRVVLISTLIVTSAAIAGLVWVAADTTRFNTSLDGWLVGLYAAGWLSVSGAPVVAWIAFRFWRDRVGSRWARVHHTLLAAAVVIFAWFCMTWRLAGTTLNY